MADKYANILFDQVQESAANTLTFNEVNIGLSLFDKVGLLISRLEWYNWDTQLQADSDLVQFGLSTSNQFAAPAPGVSSIITFHNVELRDYGVAAVNFMFQTPWVDDFSTLPGGGLLITPKPLFLFTQGTNATGASLIQLRMFFTIITLKAEDYFELLETRQFFG